MQIMVLRLGELLRDYKEEKISELFKEFSCEQEVDIEDFLKRRAIEYEKTNFGKTSIIVDKENPNSVLAYFTITHKSIDISMLTNSQKKRMLGYYPGRDSLKSISAFLIGQLGRSDNCNKEDLTGLQLLEECYFAISEASKIIGGNLIVLECREHMFEKFYMKQGYKKLYKGLNEESLYTLYKKVDFSEYWNRKG